MHEAFTSTSTKNEEQLMLKEKEELSPLPTSPLLLMYFKELLELKQKVETFISGQNLI